MSDRIEMTRPHAASAADVVGQYRSSADTGLSAREAGERLAQYGHNRLPEQKRKGPLLRFLLQFHNVLIYLLLIAALVAGLLGEWIEAGVILAVVLVNVLVSFIQEGKAQKALDGIKNMLSLAAVVIRDAKRESIDAQEVVPGDVVVLKSGNRIPADIRLLSVKNLRVEESALTGESEEVEKHDETVAADALLGDRKNMAYAGTTVAYGDATGIVTATGERTELGRINRMMTEVDEKTTPLLRAIDHFGKIISVAIILVAGGFFAFGLLVRGSSLHDMFLAAIGIIVAAIPEGLPAILTITLAMGVQRMARRNAIIRRLPSVETLGSVSVICSDKTGTLTRNEMTARSVITASGEYAAEGSGYAAEGRVLRDGSPVTADAHRGLAAVLHCAAACNDAQLSRDETGAWKLLGTPTEGALMVLAHKGGMAEYAPRRIDAIAFESEHKYMATLNDTPEGRTVFLKGAPERILAKCSRELSDEGEREIDSAFWQQKIDEIAGRGERVMACAMRVVSGETATIDHDDIGKEFVLAGLTGIIDPPRDEVIDAIEECRQAGIRVIMITGDHAITAESIARQLGIDASQGTVSGSQLEEMDDEALAETVKTHNVFARTNPEHKLRLVQALQRQRILCAMTGDGVNDAPALKTADIGIAMGIKGTEVTKEAAEMVLADDNFATIVHAVEEGRTIYDNIKKTILFLLPANGAEASVIIAAVLLGITLPISPVQILWVNMVSAVTLALCLTVEPMERMVMQRPPRDHTEPIIGPLFFWRVLFVSLLSGGASFTAFWLQYRGGSMDASGVAVARTAALNMLVIAHAFYLFSSRKLYETSLSRRIFDNHLSFIMVGVLAALQAAITYVPLMNRLFGTAPLPLSIWPLLLATGTGLLLIVEAEKVLRLKWASRREHV